MRLTPVMFETHVSGSPWREVLVALMWIVVGSGALFALCATGPTLGEYTTASVHIVMLIPLISILITAWDVSGLMLIMLGIRRLIKTWAAEQGRSRDDNGQAEN